MSKIDAADRNRQTDEIRRIREEYDEKSADNSKKTSRDMRAQNVKHQKDMENLKNEYERQITEMRNKNSDVITRRDEKNQADVENLRRIFTDTMARKSRESQMSNDALEDTFARELSKNKSINSQQKEILTKGFRESLGERDRTFESFVLRANDEMKQSLNSRSEKLKDKHKTELSAVEQDRDMKIGNLSRVLDETQKAGKRRGVEQEVRQLSQLRDKDASWQNIVRNKENQFISELDGKNRQLQATTKEISAENKYQLDKKMADIDNSNAQFKTQASGRIERQVRAAKSDAMQSRNDRVIDMIANRRIRNLERNDVVRQYEDRMKTYEDQKNQVYDMSRQESAKLIEGANHKNSRLLMDVNREAKMQQNVLKQQSREAMVGQEFIHKAQLDHVQDRAEDRVRKIMKATANETKIQTQYGEKSNDALKAKYMDNLENQREAHLQQLKDMYMRMEKRLRDTENVLTKRLEGTTEYYVDKLSSKDEVLRSKVNELTKDFESKTRTREKAVKMEMEALTQKYETRLSQAEDLNKKELDRQEKRHQEQLVAVTSRAMANAKKA
jgi:hypothetical protein